MANTQKTINDTCNYRGLPPIKKGMKCTVDGETGVIWGGNHAANFNVKFDKTNKVGNCHPSYKMKIFSLDGEVLHQSDDA